MELLANQTQAACPSPDISAYIDGELTERDEIRLEMHIAECHACREDLNLQKIFLNALDLSIEDAASIELPPEFTKSVVANAESRVSGLRRPHERRKAALICVALIVFSLFALGSGVEKAFLGLARIVEKVFAVAAVAGHFVYDIAFGSVVVSRSLAASLVFESSSAVALSLAVFVVSLFAFSRLLSRFHRT